ncbi:unnamed protein product, partial [Durusdinium trenchii]
YLALLADSRRLNALLAELSAVQGLADSAAPEEACVLGCAAGAAGAADHASPADLDHLNIWAVEVRIKSENSKMIRSCDTEN